MGSADQGRNIQPRWGWDEGHDHPGLRYACPGLRNTTPLGFRNQDVGCDQHARFASDLAAQLSRWPLDRWSLSREILRKVVRN